MVSSFAKSRARVETISDGIFAIALTLLVLSINFDQAPHQTFGEAFREAIPQIWAYALSFAVITLFYAVGYWNTFFNALLYLPDNGMWPLQMVIYTYTLQGNNMPGSGVTGIGQYAGHQAIAPLSLQMAVVTITLIPILVVYPFVQRHFTKGMLIGAIKG